MYDSFQVGTCMMSMVDGGMINEAGSYVFALASLRIYFRSSLWYCEARKIVRASVMTIIVWDNIL